MGVTPGQLLAAVVSILGTLITMHLQNRKDARIDREAQRDRDIKWDTILREHPIHSHCDLGDENTTLKKGYTRYAKPHA
jgi:hypothetical protein